MPNRFLWLSRLWRWFCRFKRCWRLWWRYTKMDRKMGSFTGWYRFSERSGGYFENRSMAMAKQDTPGKQLVQYDLEMTGYIHNQHELHFSCESVFQYIQSDKIWKSDKIQLYWSTIVTLSKMSANRRWSLSTRFDRIKKGKSHRFRRFERLEDIPKDDFMMKTQTFGQSNSGITARSISILTWSWQKDFLQNSTCRVLWQARFLRFRRRLLEKFQRQLWI